MKEKLTKGQRAEVLVQALPYIQKYYNKTVVIKYGGNAMLSEELKTQVMQDIVLLQLVGVKVVLIHGGGPEITETLNRFGIESRFVNGLRVTDAETAVIVQMVLSGKVNKNLVGLLGSLGGRAMGISGVDGNMLKVKMKDPALGYVGSITDINISSVSDLLEKGYIPVISTVGFDEKNNVYNINADTAAAAIAGELNAECLIMMTDIAGIMIDIADASSLIPVIDIENALRLIETNVISKGMIPKVESCIEAVRNGVKKVFMLDGRIPHSILVEMLTDEGAGTMVVNKL